MTNTDIATASKIMLGTTEAVAMYIGSTLIWLNSGGQIPHDYSLDYFTIESLLDSNTILIYHASGSPAMDKVLYSLDNGTTWTTISGSWTGGATLSVATINSGETLLLKQNDRSFWASNWNAYNEIKGTKNFKVYGNVMSLINGDNFRSNSEFASGFSYNLCGLFYGTTTLIDASNLILPATTLYTSSYNGMFRGCTNLTTAPQLPATQSAQDCYSSMFEGCINLEVAPEINLVNMSQACCKRMFCMNRNSKITTPKMTKSPILRCATGVSNCYEEMFKGNGNLTEITCLLTNDSSATTNWVTNISSTGTFYKSPLKTNWQSGVSACPSGWTIVDYSGV